jgi:uncharacterized protein YjbI with pentapeptide repeats
MANEEHVALLRQGVAAWNAWRDEKPNIRPDLSGADLRQGDLSGADLRQAYLGEANLGGADLRDANLSEASLARADLHGAYLSGAELTRADLREAYLDQADLTRADVSGASLRKANLTRADLSVANLTEANLEGANLFHAYLAGANLREGFLCDANLWEANLVKANLSAADLRGANLKEAILCKANLSGANLTGTNLMNADLTEADLTGCHIYGVSAWGLTLEGTKQQNLVITRPDEPEITVDDIEVAQFVYLMLNNQKVRNVIDTITSKAVLILGRFTDERKAVLDALREELRKRDYLPILFDFEKPRSRDTDETITLLARMARFIVADITNAKSVLQELRAIVPDLPSVPVQPIILEMQEEPGMFDFYRNRPSFLPVHRYVSQEQLLADLSEEVIRPAELRV